MQVGTRRTVAPAAVRGALHYEEAFLLVAVDIFGVRVARLHSGLDVGAAQGVELARSGDLERPFSTSEIVSPAVAGLHALEVGQAVRIGPASELVRGPTVVVERVAAEVHQAVDGRRAAHHPPARIVDGLAIQVTLRLTVVGPVVALALERHREGRGHAQRVEAAVHRSCL